MIMPTSSLLGRAGLIGEIMVRLEEADAEDQRKRNLGPRGSDDPCIGFDFTDFRFYGAQNMVFRQIALVEQDHVCISNLVVGGGAVEEIQAKIVGIRKRDHRVDADSFAKLRPQERQNYR